MRLEHSERRLTLLGQRDHHGLARRSGAPARIRQGNRRHHGAPSGGKSPPGGPGATAAYHRDYLAEPVGDLAPRVLNDRGGLQSLWSIRAAIVPYRVRRSLHSEPLTERTGISFGLGRFSSRRASLSSG